MKTVEAAAAQVAEWGQRVCGALRVLHEAGLVHRDVKPANLLFVEGQLCLADYGLVGEPGSQHDFSGTEGFIPLEGTPDSTADLFALLVPCLGCGRADGWGRDSNCFLGRSRGRVASAFAQPDCRRAGRYA